MSEEQIETQLQSASWLTGEADKLIKQWKACKTAYARKKLIPKMQYMKSRLAFEGRAIDQLTKLIDSEGEEWKNQS